MTAGNRGAITRPQVSSSTSSAEAFLLLCGLTASTKHLGLKKLPTALSNSSALGSLPSSLETRHRPTGTHQVYPDNVRAFVGHRAVRVYSQQCGRKLVLTPSAQCHSTGCSVTTQGPAPLAACAISSLASKPLSPAFHHPSHTGERGACWVSAGQHPSPHLHTQPPPGHCKPDRHTGSRGHGDNPEKESA